MHWRSFLGGSAATLLALAGLSRDKPLALFNWSSSPDESARGLRVRCCGTDAAAANPPPSLPAAAAACRC